LCLRRFWLESATEGVDPETNTKIARWAWRWALWTTVLVVVDGFLLLMVLPQPVLKGMMTGGLAIMGPLTLAILVAGLATVGYMVKRVLESPASGEDAAWLGPETGVSPPS
jgi:hypothetical protein